MKKSTLLSVIFTVMVTVFSFSKTILISSSESDATISLDGEVIGIGSVEVLIKRNHCNKLKIEKLGFITQEIRICNNRFSKISNQYYFDLKPDEAFNSSTQNSLSNIDFDVKTDLENEASWRQLSQIVMSHFDVIEVIDGNTGYLRSVWMVDRFSNSTVRTRIIVRQTSSNPVSYKVKIVSEISNEPNSVVANDENFKKWDRLLRKYENVIVEIQSRMNSQLE